LCVKVCGVTSLEDAEAAAAAGADLVGFNFYPSSPRCVPAATAAAIARRLPPHVVRVGVFVDPEPADVERLIDVVGLDLAQFHGDESASFCAAFPVPAIKALRVGSFAELHEAARAYPDGWLLVDSADPVLHGGTGRALPLVPVAPELAARLFVAGGLRPETVTDVVRLLRPLGVDVCSGVETSPGRKDHGRLRKFVSHAKTA
jgi:phosphoribosylanthranilate isomerase